MCTTVIDGSAHWQAALKAVNCHQSQVSIYGGLNDLPDEKSIALWGKRAYYPLSVVNSGRALETDLFGGIDRTLSRLNCHIKMYSNRI